MPPRTLTEAEADRILRVTGESAGGFRDHVIIAMALGTGLREHELLALDVGDVLAWNRTIPGTLEGAPVAGDPGQYIRRRLELRVFKGRGRWDGQTQEALLSDRVRYKLAKYVDTIRGRPLAMPLFMSQKKRRLSTRRLRELFVEWQQLAGFERLFPFHALRHTYCTNAYQESGKDIVQVQRLARHRNIATTLIYTRASDEEVLATAKKLRG